MVRLKRSGHFCMTQMGGVTGSRRPTMLCYNMVMRRVRGFPLVGIVEFIVYGCIRYFREWYASATPLLNYPGVHFCRRVNEYMEKKIEKARFHSVISMGTKEQRFEVSCKDRPGHMVWAQRSKDLSKSAHSFQYPLLLPRLDLPGIQRMGRLHLQEFAACSCARHNFQCIYLYVTKYIVYVVCLNVLFN